MSHVIVGRLFLTLLLISVGTLLTSGNECTFRDGQCIYNINLNSPGNCGIPGPERLRSGPEPEHVELQEGSTKMFQMEQDFNTVKSDHENRIRELENSIQKVLRNAIPSTVQYSGEEVVVQSTRTGSTGSTDTTRQGRAEIRRGERRVNEDTLLMQLQSQFNRLRTSLSERSADLLVTKNKLNETVDLLKETRKQLFHSSTQLAEYETKSAVLEKENSILKNRYKDKSERLEYAEEKVNASESKLSSLENQLYDVVRSESTLKEELQLYKMRLNETQKTLDELTRNHTTLKDRYSRTKTTLALREEELMECYTAKTQTFCGFEDPELCGFTQENETDTFDWVRIQGSTPSVNTGPKADHTCRGRDGIGEGHFMYIEASGRRRGHNAIMYSPKYRGLSQQCVEFYYHMYGRHVGTLTVHSKLLASNELNAVWRVFGNQGNVWILTRLSISEEIAKAGYQIVFEGATETGYEGDISVDDIRVRDGPCTDGNGVTNVELPDNQPQRNQTLTDQINRYRKLLRRRQRQRSSG